MIRRVLSVSSWDSARAGNRQINGRRRLATASDVRPWGEDRIVVVNLVGQKLTVAAWDDRRARYRPETTIRTRDGHGKVSSDLLDVDPNGRVLASNCGAGTGSLYQLEADGVRRLTSITPSGGVRGFCHGVAFVPGREDLAVLTYITNRPSLVVVEIDSGREVSELELPGWRPKSVRFDDSGRAVIPFCDGGPKRSAASGSYGTRLAIARFDPARASLELEGTLDLPDVHVDDSVLLEDLILVNNQTDDAIDVVALHGTEMTLVRRVVGFDFPHGMSVSHDGQDLLVAQYGNHRIVSVPLTAVTEGIAAA